MDFERQGLAELIRNIGNLHLISQRNCKSGLERHLQIYQDVQHLYLLFPAHHLRPKAIDLAVMAVETTTKVVCTVWCLPQISGMLSSRLSSQASRQRCRRRQWIPFLPVKEAAKPFLPSSGILSHSNSSKSWTKLFSEDFYLLTSRSYGMAD